MRRLVLIVSAALLLMMVLAACGGSGDAAPQGTAAAGTEEGPTVTTSGPKQWSSPPEMQLQEGADYRATLHTSKGDIVIDLLESETPITVNNFVFLAQQGFYNGVPFHRVIRGFMIQTGDPTGSGAGGPGYEFRDEPITRDYTPGTVAMANHGANTNGSQFFIVHGDMRGRLDKNYTIFGEVVSGMDVVDSIASVPVTTNRFGEQSRPTEQVTIETVEITTQ